MEQKRKSVNIKGYRKKHTFELETTSIGGHTFCYLKKNGNIVLNCIPKEMIKLKKLFDS